LKLEAIHLGKSLLPDEVRGAYPVEEWHFPARSKTLVEVLQEFKLGRSEERRHKSSDAIDYSTMSYEELRTIADNDSIAEKMSDEEYESLSVAMWKKFSAEKLALAPLDADAVNT
jgi:hypothetical protein